MKFIDETKFVVFAGDGGRGCVSFRRERFVPRGGPSGGDGGKGGGVIIKASPHKRTLYDFTQKKIFKAENGHHGQGSQKTGKDGEDIIIEVPVGTVISNNNTGEIIKDFTVSNEEFLVAKGGRGGKGNKHFATSTHRTPRFAQPGEPGESLSLKLELKLIADVGIIGLPNAGKSTLITAISSATPKIADYPFTTLNPTLGVVYYKQYEPFVVADIPGLIEGAHKGLGLGMQFLRHVERTNILIHLIDASCENSDDLIKNYKIVNNELCLYNQELANKRQIIVLNKLDIPEAKINAEKFMLNFNAQKIICISASNAENIDSLLSQIIKML